ncbi:MAG: DUF559 domain-containing protein [Calditrichia bacterium]
MTCIKILHNLPSGNDHCDNIRELALDVLWSYLSNKSSIGIGFRRSCNIAGFDIDFFSPEGGVIVQVCGDAEFDRLRMVMDAFNEMMLRRLGFEVLYISSEDVLLRCQDVLMDVSALININNTSQVVHSFSTGTSKAEIRD